MRTIAEVAGVSIATISRYLNKSGYISEKSTEKIEKAIEEMNYVPNELARAIFRKSSKTIGVMVPNISNPLFNQMVLLLEKYANKYGYSIFLCNTEDTPQKEKKYLDVLQSHRVAGIIVVRSHCQPEYQKINIPVVAFENHISNKIPTVSTDNCLGGKIAFEHLYHCGCKKILHIKGPSTFEATEDRYTGFAEAAKKRNQHIDIIECRTDFYENMLEDTMQNLNVSSNYDGVFVFNDITAAVLLRSLISKKIKIPDQIQLIGFDNSFIGKIIYPTLTTINQPIQEICQIMTDLLFSLIKKKPIEKMEYFIKPSLVQRQTTKTEKI